MSTKDNYFSAFFWFFMLLLLLLINRSCDVLKVLLLNLDFLNKIPRSPSSLGQSTSLSQIACVQQQRQGIEATSQTHLETTLRALPASEPPERWAMKPWLRLHWSSTSSFLNPVFQPSLPQVEIPRHFLVCLLMPTVI